jgi:hypothetical protein
VNKAKFRLPAITPQFGIAVFPCLKTSAPTCIGGYMLRSTTDLADLSDEQAAAVCEIATMLYARDDVRIAEAAYAITEPLGAFRPGPVIAGLERVRAVIGYLYSSPHPVNGDAFMPFEFSSVAVIQSANLTTFLVRPEHGTVLPPPPEGFVADAFHQTRGYEGNFNRRPLWLAKGSRLHGGHTDTILNISQDLYTDIAKFRRARRSSGELLLDLLDAPPSLFRERIFTAIDWYNSATDRYDELTKNLLSLAIAFEVLLELPSGEKTDRLTDSIALLLGRTVRLKDWASQFYAARSEVAHEGRVRDWSFYTAKPTQKGEHPHRFGSIMTYGLEIFQLCLATILTGAKLAEQSGLAERFVANSERYAQIAEKLGRATGSAVAAIASVEPLVDELDRYQFVSSPTPVGEVLKALRVAAKALSRCDLEIGEDLAISLRVFCDSSKKDDFAALTALEALEQQMKNTDRVVLGPTCQVVAKLIEVGWRSLFLIYYRLKDQRIVKTAGDT